MVYILNAIDDLDHNVDHLFINDKLDYDFLIKEIVKILYKYMVSDRAFDKFVILGDGTDIKVLGNDYKKFNEKVENGDISIHSDYFRINQNTNLGWYIS